MKYVDRMVKRGSTWKIIRVADQPNQDEIDFIAQLELILTQIRALHTYPSRKVGIEWLR